MNLPCPAPGCPERAETRELSLMRVRFHEVLTGRAGEVAYEEEGTELVEVYGVECPAGHAATVPAELCEARERDETLCPGCLRACLSAWHAVPANHRCPGEGGN